jgi:hypothetical protein
MQSGLRTLEPLVLRHQLKKNKHPYCLTVSKLAFHARSESSNLSGCSAVLPSGTETLLE